MVCLLFLFTFLGVKRKFNSHLKTFIINIKKGDIIHGIETKFQSMCYFTS